MSEFTDDELNEIRVYLEWLYMYREHTGQLKQILQKVEGILQERYEEDAE